MSQAALLLEKYHDRPIPSSAMNQFPALGNNNQTQPLEKGTFLGKKRKPNNKSRNQHAGLQQAWNSTRKAQQQVPVSINSLHHSVNLIYPSSPIQHPSMAALGTAHSCRGQSSSYLVRTQNQPPL